MHLNANAFAFDPISAYEKMWWSMNFQLFVARNGHELNVPVGLLMNHQLYVTVQIPLIFYFSYHPQMWTLEL